MMGTETDGVERSVHFLPPLTGHARDGYPAALPGPSTGSDGAHPAPPMPPAPRSPRGPFPEQPVSEHSSHSPAAADLGDIKVEPDNVPTRFLTVLAGALTVVVVALVALAIFLFDMEKANQLESKGYSDAERVERIQ